MARDGNVFFMGGNVVAHKFDEKHLRIAKTDNGKPDGKAEWELTLTDNDFKSFVKYGDDMLNITGRDKALHPSKGKAASKGKAKPASKPASGGGKKKTAAKKVQ